mmetsp:Transcript_24718/g.64398  ORF Transcript_24718/g.64398 Transcript_24718/m.64398 type:complete len:502 (-) Transcript_24718:76-1581(-)
MESEWKKEAGLFFNLAGPSVLIQLFEFALWFENSMYVGRTHSTTELAAVSLANLSGNLTAMSIIFGVLTAVDTLAPQAIGRGAPREVGLLVQRGLLVCAAFMPFVVATWRNMETLLVMVGQPPEVSRLAGVFLKVYVMCIPPMITFEVGRKFLQVQNIIRPYIYMTGFTAVVWHPFLLWLCITWMGLGIIGAAVATTLSFTTLCILSGLHITYNQPAKPSPLWLFFFDGTYDPATWQGVDIAAALHPKALKEFLWLGGSGVVSMTEWWYWEAAAFVAGRLGPVALAAHAVAYNVIPLFFMVPLGISIGTSTRQGTLLGEGNPTKAWAIAKYSLLFGIPTVCILSFMLRHSATLIVPLFTRDPEVEAMAYEIWPWFSAFTALDGVFGIQRGILIGLGRQLTLGLATIGALWITGLPVVLYAVFTLHGGLVGLWQALLVTYIVFNGVLICGYCFADWTAISAEVQTQSAISGTGSKSRKLGKARLSDPPPLNGDSFEQQRFVA